MILCMLKRLRIRTKEVRKQRLNTLVQEVWE